MKKHLALVALLSAPYLYSMKKLVRTASKKLLSPRKRNELKERMPKSLAKVLYMDVGGETSLINTTVSPNLKILDSKIDCVWFNRIYGRMQTNEIEIMKALAFFRKKSFSWWVNMQHLSLIKLLSQYQFKPIGEYFSLHKDITELTETKYRQPISVKACMLDNHDQAWLNIFAVHLQVSKREFKDWIKFIESHTEQNLIRGYLGLVSNEPHAALLCILHPQDKVVTVQVAGSSTVYPRSLEFALVYKALVDACKLGYTKGYTLCPASKQNLYTKYLEFTVNERYSCMVKGGEKIN